MVVLAAMPIAAVAQVANGSSSFVVVAPRTDDPPPMDGSIDHQEWRTAAHVALMWNVDFRRPANEGTDAYLLTDGKYIYLAFVADQQTTPLVSQRTNGSAVNNDDWVAVFLWPSGVNGFRYMFKCNAIGVCDQTSSENTAFAPLWKAAGQITRDGFIVTMRIPLDVIRGDGRDQWRLQLARQNNRMGDDTPVWAYAPGMDNEGQAEFSGYLTGMRNLGASLRSRPRVGIYGLGALASRTAGGNTSRVGADFAVPITATGSLIGALHPDYSDVELDQQTISPTEFRRQFQEVRPFFTQGATFYDKFTAIGDAGNLMLYSPAVPTPANGFAIEGTQGDYGLAAFDASSPGRVDAAQTVSWSSADEVYSGEVQRVTVDLPGFADRATAAGVRVDNQRTAYAYADFGRDAGTDVLDPTQANWAEAGAALHGPTSFLGTVLRKIGAYYNPVDGFVEHPGIAGWAANGEQDVLPRSGPLIFVSLEGSIDRYHDALGNIDEADQTTTFSVHTRSQFSFSASTASNFLLSSPQGPGGLFDQNGLSAGYRSQSTTPTTVSYNVGRFGDGYLRSWARLGSFQTGPRGSVSLEADDTELALDDGQVLKQWLERATFAYQFGPQASLAIGVRRVVGTTPPVFEAPAFVDASNVSLALHDRISRDDFYLVYGDANALVTSPQLILKWVHYFGAQQGT